MPTTSTFGELIRERRLARGMSMGQLASSVGRTAASVRRWERDEVVPSEEVIDKIAEVLELDPEELAVRVGGVEEEDGSDDAERSDPFIGMSGGETDAMPVAGPPPPAPAPTTVGPELTSEPVTERRSVGYYRDHLFDPDRPYLGYLRATLTVVVGALLVWVLIWALGALFSSLGEVWDQFSRDETTTTEAAVALLATLHRPDPMPPDRRLA